MIEIEPTGQADYSEKASKGVIVKPSDELSGFFLTKEGNSILYPLFLLGNKLQKGSKGERPIKKSFNVNVRGRKCAIEIECAD